MLQSIRDKTHGWIAGVIISLLILSFAMWGIHSYFLSSGDNNVVAKVNGIEITKNQLGAAYERLHRQMQMQSGTAQLPESAESGLKNRALQTLVHVQVLEQASLADNYRITSGQIDGFLQNMPEFQVNGVFSPVRFQQTLNAMLFSAPDFVALIRATLLTDQPRLGIIFTSFALPGEVTNTMALIGQERSIRYLTIPPNYFKSQVLTISDEAIQAYYITHQNEFKTPEQVSVEYVLFSIHDLAARIHPTEDQLKNFYAENTSSFAQSTRRSQQPGNQTYAMVKDKVKEAFAHQKAEVEFADQKEKVANVAYEHPDSLQASAKELGVSIQSTGLFTKEKAGKDITANAKVREAAFGNDVLNLQNNSDVIQINPESAVILRIKSHVPATVLPLSAVRNQIEDKLKIIATEEKLSALANDMARKLETAKSSPQQIVDEYHLQWTDAGFIGRHASKIDQAILDTAFQMAPPVESKIVYAATKMVNGFAVIGLTGVKPGSTDVSAEQYQAFSDQIQSSMGTLEYGLYQNSLMSKAKIVMEN